MKFFHIVDIFAPIFLIYLKERDYIRFWSLGFVALVLEESLFPLSFGVYLLFIFGQFILFHILKKYILLTSIAFYEIYFFILSIFLYYIIIQLACMQNLYVQINFFTLFLSFIYYNLSFYFLEEFYDIAAKN
ncbi:MAG: hypothetical protein Q9M37_03995 [Desulfonauticus sp.]|nr:hypothetical protein [Desulfonauticus sp.]